MSLSVLLQMQGKIPGKQEEAWMLNRLIKQLTEMGFPVSSTLILSVLLTIRLMHAASQIPIWKSQYFERISGNFFGNLSTPDSNANGTGVATTISMKSTKTKEFINKIGPIQSALSNQTGKLP